MSADRGKGDEKRVVRAPGALKHRTSSPFLRTAFSGRCRGREDDELLELLFRASRLVLGEMLMNHHQRVVTIDPVRLGRIECRARNDLPR